MGQRLKIRKKDLSEIIFDILKYVTIVVFTLLCIYPFYYVIIYSFSDPDLARRFGVYLWPKGFTLDTYKELIAKNELIPAFFMSVMRTVVGTTVGVFFTATAAFLVTRKDFKWKKIFYRIIIVTMYVGAGLIPTYLWMSMLGFRNTFIVYVIPGALSAYHMILIKTFIEQLPESLEEAAAIEGADFIDVFIKIVLPLSKPIIATVAVYTAVGQWNSWSDNFFYNSKKELMCLQMILQNYLRNAKALEKAIQTGLAAGEEIATSTEAIQMATVTITVMPVLFVYPMAQKHFAKGIMLGAVKG